MRDKIKMWVEGSTVDGEVALSLCEETKSRPVANIRG